MAAKMSNFGKFFRVFGLARPFNHRHRMFDRSVNGVTFYISKSSFHCAENLNGDPILIKMPKLSPTMEEGTIVKWYKKEGDTIAPGDVLCDVETDKATVAMDLEEDGILAKIIVPENTKEIKIGRLIALVVEEGEDWQNVQIPSEADMGSSDTSPVLSSTDSTASRSPPHTASTPTIHHDGHLIGPAVKNLLGLYPVLLEDVLGSGRNGAVLKGDILKTIKDNSIQPSPPVTVTPPAASLSTPSAVPPSPAKASAPTPAPAPAPGSYLPPREGAAFEDKELTGMRKTIAKRLTESKTTIPHSYATVECGVDSVMKLRKTFKEDGVKLSVNDFVIKAVAMALQQVPGVNASWSGESITYLSSIDISIAVATKTGLITPIVRNADHLGLETISSTVKALGLKARDGKLRPDEYQGGSFSISNLGMFGITEFTAVINPPQSCILAVGTSQLILDETTGNPRTVMRVTMSADARVVDDLLAARFLSVFKQNLESPDTLLTGHVQLSSIEQFL